MHVDVEHHVTIDPKQVAYSVKNALQFPAYAAKIVAVKSNHNPFGPPLDEPVKVNL